MSTAITPAATPGSEDKEEALPVRRLEAVHGPVLVSVGHPPEARRILSFRLFARETIFVCIYRNYFCHPFSVSIFRTTTMVGTMDGGEVEDLEALLDGKEGPTRE